VRVSDKPTARASFSHLQNHVSNPHELQVAGWYPQALESRSGRRWMSSSAKGKEGQAGLGSHRPTALVLSNKVSISIVGVSRIQVCTYHPSSWRPSFGFGENPSKILISAIVQGIWGVARKQEKNPIT
jgi:hypothetical protein